MKKSRILALALAFMMCFSTVAMASQPQPPIKNEHDAWVAVDEDNPVQVAISKILRLPIGTTTPNATFIFDAKPISVDEIPFDEDEPNMPFLNVGNMQVTFTEADTEEPDADNIISITIETKDILENVIFENAGEYIYEIRERKDTNEGIDDNEPYEFLSYSDGVYTLHVYVANTSDESNRDTYVYAVGVRITEPDNPETQVAGRKVDPTPGGNQSTYYFSQLEFTNDYVKVNAPVDPENPQPVTESTLNISKTVTGDLGSWNQFFKFNLHRLHIPILVETPPAYYRAYIVDDLTNTVVVAPAIFENVAEALVEEVEGSHPFIMVPSAGPMEFSLKHGQRLVFVDTPVGTSYSVTEAAVALYTASVSIRTNNIVVHTEANTESNTELTTGIRFVGELLNTADFTNNRTSVVPTGLNIVNLPFVGLIALPIIALLGFIVVKSRKKRVYSPYK